MCLRRESNKNRVVLKIKKYINKTSEFIKMDLKKLKYIQNIDNSLIDYKELKRKQLIEKIALLLKFQFNRIFKQNDYNIKSLISDLKEIVSYKEINTISFDQLFVKTKNIILKKVQSTKRVSKSLDVSNIIGSLPISDPNKFQSSQNDFSSIDQSSEGPSI